MPHAPRRQVVESWRGRSAASAIALLVLAALATGGCHSADPREELKERARQYLEMKQKREWTAIYEGLLDPEARKSVKLEDFLRVRKATMDVVGFQLVEAEVSDGNGSVRAKVDAVVPVLSPQGGTTMLRRELEDSQHWVQRDDRWYIQLRG